MRVRTTLLMLAVGAFVCPGLQLKAQPPKPQPKADAVAGGVFVGRSGKPMAKARLFLGEVAGDEETTYALIRLPDHLPSAVADEEGRFEFKSFPPGKYTIVYQPAGTGGVLPRRFSIKALVAVDSSMAPGLRGIEMGTSEPFAERAWGRTFALLKGHTFMTEGNFMKIWNATLRRNPQGPFLEMRRGLLWMQQLGDKSQIKFEGWGF